MKKKLKALTILMSCALLILLLGISYLVRNAYISQKDQINQQLNFSLNEVSEVLDQKEKVLFLKKYNVLDTLISSPAGNSVFELKQEIVSAPSVDTIKHESSVQVIYTETAEQVSDTNDMHVFMENIEGNVGEFHTIIEKVIHESKEKEGKTFSEDSLRKDIQQALQRNNIYSDFELALFDQKPDTFLIGHKLEGGVTKSLFPKDILFPNRYELTVKLGNTPYLILYQMRTSLLLIALFTIAILSSFIYALVIILRQKKLDQVKTDFINNMTHEFKTPLASIALAADTVIHPEIITQTEKIQDLVTVIKSEKSKMMENIERVLDIAKLDKEGAQLKLELTNMTELIEDVLMGYKVQLEEIHADINLEFPEQEVLAEVDPVYMGNAISNLIDNSIKYRKDQLVLSIKLKEENKVIYLSIADNGIGIHKNAHNRVFDKFYREETGDIHNVKGFGLGLNFVKNIVNIHGGSISLESSKGKGTTVTLTLPQYA